MTDFSYLASSRRSDSAVPLLASRLAIAAGTQLSELASGTLHSIVKILKKLLQLLPRFLEDSWLKHDIYMFSYVTDYSGKIYSSITSNIYVFLVMIYTLKSLNHKIGTAKVCCARELMGSCAVQRAPDSEIFSTIHNI